MTLLELVIVMALVGILLGMGAGMFSTLNLGERAAVGLVQNVLRSAHNTAATTGAPARVVFDREAGLLRAEGMRVIGTWHFETEGLAGARGLDGDLGTADLADDGWLGRGLFLAGGPRSSRAEVPIGNDPGFDVREGFSVSFALRAESVPGAFTGGRVAGGKVLDIGGSVGLDVAADGALRAWMRPEVTDESGRPGPGGPRAAVGLAHGLALGKWVRIRIDYDRRALRLFADGVPIAMDETESPVWQFDGPLVLGAGRGSFSGTVDALVVRAVSDTEEVELPEGVTLTPEAPQQVFFAPGGDLDRERHPGPILFHVEFQDGTRAPVRVGLYGTVE